jgi:hypothetical protein
VVCKVNSLFFSGTVKLKNAVLWLHGTGNGTDATMNDHNEKVALCNKIRKYFNMTNFTTKQRLEKRNVQNISAWQFMVGIGVFICIIITIVIVTTDSSN